MDAPRLLIIPEPVSELEQLLGMLGAAEAAARDAEANLDRIKTGIKNLAAKQAEAMLPPGEDLPKAFSIAGDAYRPALTQRWKTPRRLNRAKLDTDYPGLWEAYAEYGQGYWEIREAG